MSPQTGRPTPGQRSDLRVLLRIATPNVVSMACESVMSFLEFMIVADLGAGAQAAVACGGLIYYTVFGLVLGVMICVTTMVSQSLGAGCLRDCSTYGWQGVWVSAFFGLLGIALWPAVPALMAWVGHAPEVQRLEVDYTRIRLAGMAAAGAAVAMGHFFNGIHRPRHYASAMVVTTLLNVVLAYGLVVGRWGLPSLGVAGAAIASVLAAVVRMGWLIGYMCVGPGMGRYMARRMWRPDAEKLRRLIAVGWPTGVMVMMDTAAWAIMLTVVVGAFGTYHLAASSACWRFVDLSFMPAVGIAHAVCTMVGRSIGQGRPDMARRRALIGAIVNASYMGSMGLIFLLFGPWLMQMVTDEGEVIRVGTQLLMLAAVFQVFDAVAITYSNALRGAGDTLWQAAAGAVLVWGLLVGGSVWIRYVHPEWGAVGPWGVATVYVIATGIVFAWRWRTGAWEHLDVIGRLEAGVAGGESRAG